MPDAEQIAKALQAIDYRHIVISDKGLTKHSPVTLDVSAIAKGYAVDQVADFLHRVGVVNFLVEVGGEIRVSGHNAQNKLWRVGVETPGKAYGVAFDAIRVTDMAVATSGDYRNYYEHEGKRYSHTIDPTTGYPIAHDLVSVTVLSKTAAHADGLATAINVMGPDKGLAFSELHSLAVLLIVKKEAGFDQTGFDETSFKALTSSAFKAAAFR
jgi:thiamine biosynthesis lipoprotein